MKFSIPIFLTGLILTLSFKAFAENTKVPYPEGYRNWYHVKSMVIQPGHPLADPFQGIHHVYANSKARQGLQNGTYPDGSVLVFDLLEYTEKDNAGAEGKRKLTGVMKKDAKKYTKTGGWGFEGFSGDSKTERLVSDGGDSCFACHKPQKDTDYVYSKLRK